MTWVDKMTIEYKNGVDLLKRYKFGLSDSPEDEEEKHVINGMISDMSYALEWMKRGRRPGNLRGIERRSVYQRTALVDMNLFPSLDIEPERTITESEKKRLYEILVNLSDRERQCYLMHMSYGMSYSEIAEALNIARPTVQTFVERAQRKIKKIA